MAAPPRGQRASEKSSVEPAGAAMMCTSRKDEMTGDVFDLLLSLGDFNEFKDRMLAHKTGFNGNAFLISGAFFE